MPRQMPSIGTPPSTPLADQPVEPELADPLHRLRERADPGQDEPVGGAGASWSLVITASAPTRSSAFSTERRLPMP